MPKIYVTKLSRGSIRDYYNDRRRIHKPKFSKVSGRSQDMRNYWINRRLAEGARTINFDINLDEVEDKLPEKERVKRLRNRTSVGEAAILARIQNRAEARKLQEREALEREARELNEVLMSQKEQAMSPKARKMGIRPSTVGCIKL